MSVITFAALLLSVACISSAQLIAKNRLDHFGPMPAGIQLPRYLWFLASDALMWVVVAIAALGAFCWYFSLSRVPLSTAVYFLILIYPAMTCGGALFLGEKIVPMQILGMVLMLVGMIVLLKNQSTL